MARKVKSPQEVFRGKKATSNMEMTDDGSDERLHTGLRNFTINNVIQYSVSLVIILAGIVISLCFNANTSIEIGSIVHGDTSVSSIRISLGPLLVLVGTIALVFAFKYNSFELRK